jgi:hypothetical protein
LALALVLAAVALLMAAASRLLVRRSAALLGSTGEGAEAPIAGRSA